MVLHGGDYLELADVKYSYDLFIEKNPLYRHFVDEVIILPNGNALQLKLSKWLEIEYLPTPYIIPRSYMSDDECFEGTGPHRIGDEEQENRQRSGLQEPVTFESHKEYFGKKAHIRRIEFRRFDEIEVLRSELENGNIDLGYNIHPKSSDDTVSSDRFEVKHGKGSIALYLILDQESDIFKNETFREVIDSVLDRDKLIQSINPQHTTKMPNVHLYLLLRDREKWSNEGKADRAEVKNSFDRARAENRVPIQ